MSAARTPPPAARPDNPTYIRRRRINAVMMSVSTAALAFGLFWLIWILYTTVTLGVSGLSVQLFTEMTPPPGQDTGGLLNPAWWTDAKGGGE